MARSFDDDETATTAPNGILALGAVLDSLVQGNSCQDSIAACRCDDLDRFEHEEFYMYTEDPTILQNGRRRVMIDDQLSWDDGTIVTATDSLFDSLASNTPGSVVLTPDKALLENHPHLSKGLFRSAAKAAAAAAAEEKSDAIPPMQRMMRPPSSVGRGTEKITILEEVSYDGGDDDDDDDDDHDDRDYIHEDRSHSLVSYFEDDSDNVKDCEMSPNSRNGGGEGGTVSSYDDTRTGTIGTGYTSYDSRTRSTSRSGVTPYDDEDRTYDDDDDDDRTGALSYDDRTGASSYGNRSGRSGTTASTRTSSCSYVSFSEEEGIEMEHDDTRGRSRYHHHADGPPSVSSGSVISAEERSVEVWQQPQQQQPQPPPVLLQEQQQQPVAENPADDASYQTDNSLFNFDDDDDVDDDDDAEQQPDQQGGDNSLTGGGNSKSTDSTATSSSDQSPTSVIKLPNTTASRARRAMERMTAPRRSLSSPKKNKWRSGKSKPSSSSSKPTTPEAAASPTTELSKARRDTGGAVIKTAVSKEGSSSSKAMRLMDKVKTKMKKNISTPRRKSEVPPELKRHFPITRRFVRMKKIKEVKLKPVTEENACVELGEAGDIIPLYEERGFECIERVESRLYV